jgi:hypothetical protein
MEECIFRRNRRQMVNRDRDCGIPYTPWCRSGGAHCERDGHDLYVLRDMTMRKPPIVLVLMGVLGVGSFWPAQAAPEDQAPASRAASAPSLDLAGCLSAPAGESQRFEAKLTDLNKRIAAATTPLDRAAAHLAVANWLLAVPVARPATRWLMGMEAPGDPQRLAGATEQALEHLDRARSILKAAKPGRGGLEKRRADLDRVADALEPFGKLFAAAGLSSDAEKRKAAFANAALDLAVARESEMQDLSACALLWQSFAWQCAGRRERAMVSLPNALTAPEQPSFDFLGRLLRCRLTAEEGQRAAAFALLIRVRGMCDQWFFEESAEAIAARRRLAALLQYRIGQSWLDKLKASGSQGAIEDLQAMLDGLREALADKDGCGPVYIPDQAVPILIEPPAATTTAPTTAPASRSAPAKD